MAFTSAEKQKMVAALESVGWRMEDGTIWSPTRGLYFNRSHFEGWTPKEMRDVFSERRERIERAQFQGWEQAVQEHEQVCSAVDKLRG